MASITFNPKGGSVAPAANDETPKNVTLEVAKDLNHSSAITTSSEPAGNISREDIILPRVNLVQKSGKLCDDFQPGSFLFEKQVVLAKPGESFTAVVLGHTKYYQEKVEYGSDEFGRRANSEEEVRKLGGTTTWGVNDMPYFQPVADLLIAVKAPQSADGDVLDLFPYQYGDEHYAIAVYTVASSAYTSLAKRVITDSLYTLKAGLHLGEYQIHSELKKNAANSWYIPVPAMPKKYNDEAKAQFFADLRNN